MKLAPGYTCVLVICHLQNLKYICSWRDFSLISIEYRSMMSLETRKCGIQMEYILCVLVLALVQTLMSLTQHFVHVMYSFQYSITRYV